MSDQLRILVVDDDRLIVEMLADLFRAESIVVTASRGDEAISHIESTDFDAVLCDQIMPGIKGVQVLQACLEKQPQAARILVTASQDISDVRDAINLARVHRVVSKPFREVEVDSIVRGAMREVQLESENERLLAELKEREVELEEELSIRTQELKDVMEQLVRLQANT